MKTTDTWGESLYIWAQVQYRNEYCTCSTRPGQGCSLSRAEVADGACRLCRDLRRAGDD